MKKITLIIVLLAISHLLLADASDEFQFAKKMYDDTLYEEAIGKFQEIVKNYPTSSEAEESELYIGNCYMALQQYDKAISSYQHLIDAYPDSKLVPNAIYKLAESQYKNKDFAQSAKNYQQLINNYPQSPFSISSLQKVIKSYQHSHQSNEAILVAQNILKHYANQPQVPDIYLLLADVYMENNIPEQFEMSLEKVITDYSRTDAKWIAIKKLAEYYQSTGRSEEATEMIQKNISEVIPRKFEKDLLLLSAEIFFQNKNYELACKKYQEYFRKFDTEPNLDEVAYKIAVTNFELADYQAVQQNCSDFVKEFPKSKFMPEIFLLLAKNYIKQKNYEKALSQLGEQNFTDAKKETKFQMENLKANIFTYQQLWDEAITHYLNLIQNFGEFVAVDSCYFKIAQIYQKRLKKYESAINYYQSARPDFIPDTFPIYRESWRINTYSQSKFWQEIQIEMADCYQKMQQYDKALNILQLAINQGSLSADMEKKINENIHYIKKYKIKEKDAALENLMDGFITYLKNKDENKALASIIKIYTDDLKEYEKAIKIFEQNKKLENDPKLLLLKGETYQSLAKKLEYESARPDFIPDTFPIYRESWRTAEKYYKEAQKTFQRIATSFPDSSEKPYAEYYLITLNLRQYPKGSEEYTAKLKEYSSAFIEKYSTFPMIGNVYYNFAKALMSSNGDEQKIILYLTQSVGLSHDENIIRSAHTSLGDIYLRNESYQAALNQYQKIDEEIIYKNGNILFNLGFVQMKLNHLTESAKYFQQFVNKFKQHKKYWDGVENLANIYDSLNKTEQAIHYFSLITSHKQDDALFRTLRDLYVDTQKFDKSIEISLKIKERTNEDRRALAEVYHKKGDESLAILQYQKVIENDAEVNKRLQDIEQLAGINFAIGQYQAAVRNYEKILNLTDSYKNRFSALPFLDWKQIGENLIISCYRKKSRKDAEEYEQTFKGIIDANKELKAHLFLERGKYYVDLNNKKANKIFNEIIKDYGTSEYADDSYFQQALIALQKQDFGQAETKLKTLIQKYPNSELVNNANLKLGSLNFTQGNFQDALKYYQFVIHNDKEGSLAIQAIENFALTCKSMGEWMSAIEAYQLLLDRFGTPEIKPQTLFEIAFCYYRDKKYQKAIDLFDKILPKIQKRSTKGEIYYWIGESYFELEEYNKAIESFLKIVYDYSDFAQWDVNANIKIAMSYENLHKYDKARLFYNNVIEKYGVDSKWGKEAKKLLDMLP
jgi:TolA-binding protein